MISRWQGQDPTWYLNVKGQCYHVMSNITGFKYQVYLKNNVKYNQGKLWILNSVYMLDILNILALTKHINCLWKLIWNLNGYLTKFTIYNITEITTAYKTKNVLVLRLLDMACTCSGMSQEMLKIFIVKIFI